MHTPSNKCTKFLKYSSTILKYIIDNGIMGHACYDARADRDIIQAYAHACCTSIIIRHRYHSINSIIASSPPLE